MKKSRQTEHVEMGTLVDQLAEVRSGGVASMFHLFEMLDDLQRMLAHRVAMRRIRGNKAHHLRKSGDEAIQVAEAAHRTERPCHIAAFTQNIQKSPRLFAARARFRPLLRWNTPPGS